MAVTLDHPNKSRVSLARLTIIMALALILFGGLFAPKYFVQPGFWWRMSIVVALLNALAFILDRRHAPRLWMDVLSRPLSKIALGLLSAGALYLVFFAGNMISRYLLPFAAANIGSIYAQKETADITRIVLLLALIIGPGEELFWRAFLQRNLAGRIGKNGGTILTALLYGGVHAISGNVMLIVAAFVAGLFWGWMYQRFESPLANVVSHTTWDLLVFVILPFGA